MPRQSCSRSLRFALICGAAAFVIYLPASRHVSGGITQTPSGTTCVECHRRAEGRAREAVELHLRSSHSRVGCQGCHGGDPAENDRTLAHGGDFIGKPDRQETLARCGRCHQMPLEQFRQSRHFPERRNIPRLDCAECHGAHTVGDPPETFGFATLCSSCHGLEYLPELPLPVQRMLALTDELRDAQRVAEWKKKSVPAEFIAGRKALRRSISEIVHPTDIAGGLAKIPEIIKRGESLKSLIGK